MMLFKVVMVTKNVTKAFNVMLRGIMIVLDRGYAVVPLFLNCFSNI